MTPRLGRLVHADREWRRLGSVGKEINMRLTVAVAATLSFSTMLLAADSYVGTWKLNVAKIQTHRQ